MKTGDQTGFSANTTALPIRAAASTSIPSSLLPESDPKAILPHGSPDLQASQRNCKYQGASSSMPAANDFRSRAYALVSFQPEMYSRIKFLISPSVNRNRNTSGPYARIMGLEEAQKVEIFRAGVFERLREMGEIVGSRKLVAKPDFLYMPFVVETDHDHYSLLETLKAWGERQVKGPCVVYVSLEDEV